MSVWTWPVASGERAELTPRVRVARFGDGYEQRVGDGINRLARRWSIRLAASQTVVNQADAFLRGLGGVQSFAWTALDGQPGRWVCRAWSIAYGPADGAELTATFEEVFE